MFQEGRIRGTLFIPNSNEYQNGPYPTIISLYGGINQGKVVEERSALFASRGFVSLALAYFGVDGLPKNYFDLGKIVVAWNITIFVKNIKYFVYSDLEYFEEAVNYLCRQNFVKTSHGIGVVGISKAAEIALLMGTYFDDKVCLLADGMTGMLCELRP